MICPQKANTFWGHIIFSFFILKPSKTMVLEGSKDAYA